MNIPKYFLILGVFMTNNIVNSEHNTSTAKSLCYMDPPVLVSKCQPTKMATILNRDMNSWLWRLYFHFVGSFGISKYYEYTLTDA